MITYPTLEKGNHRLKIDLWENMGLFPGAEPIFHPIHSVCLVVVEFFGPKKSQKMKWPESPTSPLEGHPRDGSSWDHHHL